MNLLTHIMNDDAAAMSDAELESGIAYCQKWRPLFHDLPKGISLLDAALCKFHRRDRLGIEFMHSHEIPA